ncbi:hypothetical protein F5B22DRAFT_661343 [Xylaria bambusicola]|uniref:uncharacterized protein n=1 Tax=Xylaria bambusicola TaxID=326684 RepID=UPI00200803B0|nr:uncharacterized protein F5B22DRAFT_661343 [Xylaria bambusicola]KAI0522035.1 hypothetical protein F5B22DRAFT_661343 [Xylaria bambusicola]
MPYLFIYSSLASNLLLLLLDELSRLKTQSRISYESSIPKLREDHERNQSSFLLRFPAEIRNDIMEYSVTLDHYVNPIPVHGHLSVNKFVWGGSELRKGILDGRRVGILFPTDGPLAVVSLQLACRQLYHELDGVFYRVNTFLFRDAKWCERYLAAITAEKRLQIRHVGIDFSQIDLFNGPIIDYIEFPLGFLPKSLLAICPLLERFIILLGNCPPPHIYRPYINRSRLTDRGLPPAYTSFSYEHHMVRWQHCDRYLAQTLCLTSRFVSSIGHLFATGRLKNSPLAIPQLEFVVSGSSSVTARVNGQVGHRSNSSSFNIHRQNLEANLAWANQKMWEFKKRLRETPAERVVNHSKDINSLTWTDSNRIQLGPIPNVARFRPAPKLSEDGTKSSFLYDASGLIVWSKSSLEYIRDILWLENEIMCCLVNNPPNHDKPSFEPIWRFASPNGVRKLVQYYFRPRPRQTQPNISQWEVLMFDILKGYPSPRDIDRVLKATGRLGNSEASNNVYESWEQLVASQDRCMQVFKQRLAQSEVASGLLDIEV